MAAHTDLLVVGAGPYAFAVAAHARAHGIGTTVAGRPMSFWREHMPPDMYLRSGPDWHLDADGVHTFEAYFEDRGLRPEDHAPVPIGTFLDHTEWFRERTGLDVDERLVTALDRVDGHFEATFDDGTVLDADRVVAAPGIAHFTSLPSWAEHLPEHRRTHTCDLVAFDQLAGARVAVVGGRQSAYEWAALLCDHGAERVDVVHRHPVPEFAAVSWRFVDPYVEQTLAHRGWWRDLPAEQRAGIAAEFWRVGRLTLEPWLVPRLTPTVVTRRPGCAVVGVAATDHDVRLVLSDGTAFAADHVVFATGYQADLAAVPYLAPVLDRVSTSDGFPDLSPGFETSLPGLYVVGFAATKDFGPFYGFTKGCPSAARIVVSEMLA
ncbi:MAG: FAD-dependent oxidoreductase [Nocardioidaceae bacterium]|nr:FAD-dependent oxidoreductase [Nocardioidaceae bacterium]NUS50604.1 FAD-dependent oxidoreductase [Nocardioidaceae bacterium]